MGEIADDIINGECCALCGCYFVCDDLDADGNEVAYDHGYPVACYDCHDGDCSYQRADAETFTRLLPIRIVMRSRLGSSRSFAINFEFLTLSLTILCRVILPRDKSAISAAEKNADKAIRATKTKS